MYTLVASVVARTDDEVLLVREGKSAVQGTWNLPGGRVEKDEVPTDTAVRELEEEVGVSVELEELVGVYLGQDAFIDGTFLSVAYLGRVSGEPHAVSTDTVEAAEWIDTQRLDDIELRSPYVLRAVHDASERTFPKEIIRPAME